MSEEIKQELDRVLDDLKDELRDKPQGYATEIPIAKRLFPETEPPRIQVVLLDPDENKVAFRRVSDLLQGERKSDWYVGELEEVIDDALSWEVELEEAEDSIDEEWNEEFEE